MTEIAIDPKELDATRQSLREATARNDAGAVLDLAHTDGFSVLLQASGEGLIMAMQSELDRVAMVAERVIAALRDRDWDGDEELALLIAARSGGEPTGRKPVFIDLAQLMDSLEGDIEESQGGYVDLETGMTWPAELLDSGMMDDPPEIEDDPDRWLYAPNQGSRAGWRDMRDFAASLPDPVVSERLLEAIEGRVAFSRFSRTLDRHENLYLSWLAFGEERRAGRARAWLASEGYDAVPQRLA